ncbi:MAG: hypothetical protein U1D30_16565 [Planctomycetota bacterium]
MPAPETMLDLYLHLACASDAEGRPLQRDKFLILAAEIAHVSGYGGIAEQCRIRVLERNPNHMLKYFASMREALGSDEVRSYTRQLFRLYPFERAEHLLSKYRASGYTGHHGFHELNSIGDSSSSPRSGPKRRRRSPPTEIHIDRPASRDKGPRPELERAFREMERPVRKSPRNPRRESAAQATEILQNRQKFQTRIWYRTVGAFTLGLVIGSILTAWWITVAR